MSKQGNGEGSVYRRKSDGRWVAAVSIDFGRRRVFYARSRSEARQKLRSALGQRDGGTLLASPRQTFGQFVKRWLEDTVKPTAAPRTHQAYEEKLRIHVLPWLERVPLERLNPAHLSRLYRLRLEAGKSPTTVNFVHNVIHRALAAAVRQQLLARNVADLVEPPRVARRELVTYSAEQLAQLRQAIQGHRFETLWTLLLTTGLRFGEAAALTWEAVSIDDASLDVRSTLTRLTGDAAKKAGRSWSIGPPKTKRSRRRIPLMATAVAALRQQKRQQLEARIAAGPAWRDHGFVFTTRDGAPVRETHALSEFKEALRASNLVDRTLHDLRHQFATLFFAAQENPRAAQDILGHSNIATTLDTYTGAVPQVLRDSVRRVDALMNPPPTPETESDDKAV